MSSGPAARTETFRALTLTAEGRKADTAKPMKGFGSGVFEVALKNRTDAYRTVCALQLADAIWVVHALRKKVTQGIKTPQKDLDLIHERFNRLQQQLSQ
jgi:phage-related protein